MSENKDIKIKIVTPEKTVFEGDFFQATIPTMDGEITILPNHRTYISVVKPGEIILKNENDKDELSMAVSGGFIEFDSNNQLTILADTAERADEIDLERAEEARKKAEELKNKRIEMDETAYARILVSLDKQLARIRVARKRYSRRNISMQ